MNNEHIDLIDDYLDHALDEAGLREVKRLLAESPEFRRELVWARRLRGYGAPVPGDLRAKVRERLQDLPPVMWPRSGRPPAASEAHATGVNWRRWAAVAALFAVLASVAGVYLWTQGNLGTIRECGGTVALMRGGREIALAPGAAVRAGDQLRAGRDGSALVVYRDGTTLAVSPETQLAFGSLEGAKYVRLESGAIHMDVTKQPADRPLEIATGHARCTVRGTKFDVTATAGYSRLDVQEGKVEMRATGQPEKTVMVTAGQHAVTDGTAAPALHAADEPVFRSAPLTRSNTPDGRVHITADIRGAKKLYLVVLGGKDINYSRGATWVNPRLVGPSGRLSLVNLLAARAREGWAANWTWAKPPAALIALKFSKYPQLVTGLPVAGIAKPAVFLIECDLPSGYERFEAEGVMPDVPTTPPRQSAATGVSVTFEVYTQLTPKKRDALRNSSKAP